jgi:hypothetical protein
MTIRINILVLIAVLLAGLLVAHKALGADVLLMEKNPPAPKVVCVGYYDKDGELVMQVCPAPSGLESESGRILKGE